ncbi:hypothetical protein PLESTM_000693400 [Pleodorina starrii]|nr:hypothetical protein PLESTM_000693400 [Pleodorina starrii]
MVAAPPSGGLYGGQLEPRPPSYTRGQDSSSAGSTPFGPAMDSQPYPPPLPSTTQPPPPPQQQQEQQKKLQPASSYGPTQLNLQQHCSSSSSSSNSYTAAATPNPPPPDCPRRLITEVAPSSPGPTMPPYFQNHLHGDAPVLVSQPSQRILSYRRSEHGGYPHLDPHHHTMGASGGGGLREVAVLIRGATAPPLGFPHFLGLHAADGGGHVLGLGLGLGGSGGDSDGDSGTDQAAAAGTNQAAAQAQAPPLAGLAAGKAPAPRPRHPTAWEDATAALASLDLGSSRRQGPPARKRPRVDLGGGVDGNTGS